MARRRTSKVRRRNPGTPFLAGAIGLGLGIVIGAVAVDVLNRDLFKKMWTSTIGRSAAGTWYASIQRPTRLLGPREDIDVELLGPFATDAEARTAASTSIASRGGVELEVFSATV